MTHPLKHSSLEWLIQQLELRDSELTRREGELAKLDESLAQRDATMVIAAFEAQLSSPADSQPRTRSRAGRQPLPDHLVREIHVHKPDS